MTASFLRFPGLAARMQKEPLFGVKMLEMAERLNLDPNSILSVMSVETAGTFDPAIENPLLPISRGGPVGLIQFMPNTAKVLGTTSADLKRMSAVEQLQYVERFFKMNGGRIRKDVPGDYYMAVFMPAFVGAPQDMVLGRKGDDSQIPGVGLTYSSVYRNNPGFDHDKDGVFNVHDVWATTLGRIASVQNLPRIEVTAPSPLPEAVSSPPPVSLPPAWHSSGGQQDLPVLHVGDKGSAVALLQTLLGCQPTGIYTEEVANFYVKPLQAKHGLKVDGIVGPLTWYKVAAGERPSP